MKNNSVKIVVATGIGAALFVIIGWLINIPTPIPNTSIQLQYAVLALFSALFGPLAGFLIGFIGHALKDSFLYGAPWWTWVLGSGLIGLFLAFGVKRETLTQGIFGNKEKKSSFTTAKQNQTLARTEPCSNSAVNTGIILYLEKQGLDYDDTRQNLALQSSPIPIPSSTLQALFF